jgi:hypothetical protein
MQLSFHLFILLLGFVLGNLFPTFFGDFLGKVGTPLFLFLALDFFNYFYYVGRTAATGGSSPVSNSSKSTNEVGSILKTASQTSSPRSGLVSSLRVQLRSSFSTRANSLKIGFLFGLFVDAFKVGS